MIKFRLVIQPQVQVQVQTRLGIVHILSLEQNKAGNALAAAALMHHGNHHVIVLEIIGLLHQIGLINQIGGKKLLVILIPLKFIQILLYIKLAVAIIKKEILM
jgi:hypothetical protein